MTGARNADTPPLTRGLRFYAGAVEDAAELIEAAEVSGVDAELASLRVALRKHVQEHPDDLELMLKSVRLIAQVVSAQYRMSPARTDEFAETASAVLRQMGAQMFPERFGAL
jgi:hypothetical protein